MADTPQFQRTEQLTPATQPMPFGEAFRNLAASSNVLSQFGSELAMKAAVKRSEITGMELGKNPKGDLFGPITQADKAFHEAYRTSAMNTLSIKGAELLNNSLLTLKQANRLSPDILESFRSNVLSGIDEIVAQAPTADRPAIQNQLTTQMLHANSKLETRLIEEQKTEVVDSFRAYEQESRVGIFDLSAATDHEGARSLSESLDASIQSMYDSRLISETERDQALKTNRLTLLTGIEYSNALESLKSKSVEDYLSDLGKNGVPGATPTEDIAVLKNVMELIGQKQRADSQNQVLLSSIGDLAISKGDVNQAIVSRLQEEMDPTEFNNFMAKNFRANAKGAQFNLEKQRVIDNFNNPGIVANLDKKAQESVYDDLWQTLSNNEGVDPYTAKTLVAGSFPVPVDSWNNETAAMARSRNPELMISAANGMKYLNQIRPGNLEGFSSDAVSALNIFDTTRGMSGDQAAADAAVKDVYDVDKSKREQREAVWNKETLRMFGYADENIVKNTFNMIGVKPKYMDTSPIAFAYLFKDKLRDNYLSGGNMEVAKKNTIEWVKRTHGYTRVNGREIFTFNPIETSMEITEQQMPLIYKQLGDQIQVDINKYNELYDKKAARGGYQSDFKYEFDIIEAPGALPTRLYGYIFGSENKTRPSVTRIYRDGTKEKFYLNVSGRMDAGLINGSPIYDVRLEQQMDNNVIAFQGLEGYLGGPVTFIPNKAQLNQNYISDLNSRAESGNKEAKELIDSMKDPTKKARDALREILKKKGIVDIDEVGLDALMAEETGEKLLNIDIIYKKDKDK